MSRNVLCLLAGAPGIFNVSTKLIDMLQALPRKTEYVFGKPNKAAKQYSLRLQRQRLAQKLQNPRLEQITFHTFRHWKGTIEYHKTKDIIHVQQLLRHRQIENTLVYISIEQAMFQTENNEFHVKVANTLEEACKLLEVGFDYVTDMEGKKVFRKRK